MVVAEDVPPPAALDNLADPLVTVASHNRLIVRQADGVDVPIVPIDSVRFEHLPRLGHKTGEARAAGADRVSARQALAVLPVQLPARQLQIHRRQ